MKKYIINYLDHRGRKGCTGVQAETPADAINIFRTEHAEKYNAGFANYAISSVDEWCNKRIRIIDFN